MTVLESSDKQISLLFQFDEELAKKLKVKDRAHFRTCTNFFDRACILQYHLKKCTFCPKEKICKHNLFKVTNNQLT